VSVAISPLASVDPAAVLGNNVAVGPFCVIGPGVEIGDDCVIHSHVVIKGPTRIGAGNEIYSFAVVGEATPDLKYAGEPTTLTIGDHNVIREGVTLHRGTVQDRGDTQIGSNNLLMAYVHVGHDSVVGDHCILVNNAALAGHVIVDDYAILSGYTLVHQRCRIGTHAFTGMGSAIGKDVPAFVTVTGAPAEARAINVEGLRRRNFSREDLAALSSAFKVVYRRGLTLDEALDTLRSEAASNPAVAQFVASLEASTRGITR